MAEENIKKVEEKVEVRNDEAKVEKKTEKPKKVENKNVKEEKIELEREYVIPIKKNILTAPRYKRAKKAIRVIREFLVKHMGIRDRDLRKVKIDKYLNEEIWFKGIKKPLNKVKVKAVKKGGIVYVELAEIPEVVKWKKQREEKKNALVDKKALKKVAKAESEEKEIKESREDKADKVDDKEKGAATKDAGVKANKVAATESKHSTVTKHKKTTAPIRKAMKK